MSMRFWRAIKWMQGICPEISHRTLFKWGPTYHPVIGTLGAMKTWMPLRMWDKVSKQLRTQLGKGLDRIVIWSTEALFRKRKASRHDQGSLGSLRIVMHPSIYPRWCILSSVRKTTWILEEPWMKAWWCVLPLKINRCFYNRHICPQTTFVISCKLSLPPHLHDHWLQAVSFPLIQTDMLSSIVRNPF